MALSIAQKRGTITTQRFREMIAEIETIPAKIEKVLQTNDMIYQLNENVVVLYDWKRIHELKKYNVYQSGIVESTKFCPGTQSGESCVD